MKEEREEKEEKGNQDSTKSETSSPIQAIQSILPEAISTKLSTSEEEPIKGVDKDNPSTKGAEIIGELFFSFQLPQISSLTTEIYLFALPLFNPPFPSPFLCSCRSRSTGSSRLERPHGRRNERHSRSRQVRQPKDQERKSLELKKGGKTGWIKFCLFLL